MDVNHNLQVYLAPTPSSSLPESFWLEANTDEDGEWSGSAGLLGNLSSGDPLGDWVSCRFGHHRLGGVGTVLLSSLFSGLESFFFT